jgi:iron complex outermembrane receptor protein
VNALDPVLQTTAASEGFDLDEFVAYDEEEITNYEIGLKGTTADRSFRYAIALYYLDWTGYVQPVTANWTPDDGVLLPGTGSTDYFSRIFVNTGDLDGLGFELEAQWTPSERWLFGGALSYSGLEFTGDSCSPIPLDYGVPAIQTEPYACANVGGKKPPMFSPFTLYLNGTYTYPLSTKLDGYGRVDYAYRSKRYTEQINTDYIEGYSIVNLRLGVSADQWSAEFFVDNLFDDDTPSGAVRFFDGRQPGMVFGTSYVLRRPRIFGIRLSYDF